MKQGIFFPILQEGGGGGGVVVPFFLPTSNDVTLLAIPISEQLPHFQYFENKNFVPEK